MKTKLEILELYRGMVDNLNKLNATVNHPSNEMTTSKIKEVSENLEHQHQMNSVVEWILEIEKCWTPKEVAKLIRKEPPYVSDDFQIGPNGAYEHIDDSDTK
jgi:DNA-binding transcriptional regulator GbsR (MarR family)